MATKLGLIAQYACHFAACSKLRKENFARIPMCEYFRALSHYDTRVLFYSRPTFFAVAHLLFGMFLMWICVFCLAKRKRFRKHSSPARCKSIFQYLVTENAMGVSVVQTVYFLFKRTEARLSFVAIPGLQRRKTAASRSSPSIRVAESNRIAESGSSCLRIPRTAGEWGAEIQRFVLHAGLRRRDRFRLPCLD